MKLYFVKLHVSICWNSRLITWPIQSFWKNKQTNKQTNKKQLNTVSFELFQRSFYIRLNSFNYNDMPKPGTTKLKVAKVLKQREMRIGKWPSQILCLQSKHIRETSIITRLNCSFVPLPGYRNVWSNTFNILVSTDNIVAVANLMHCLSTPKLACFYAKVWINMNDPCSHLHGFTKCSLKSHAVHIQLLLMQD